MEVRIIRDRCGLIDGVCARCLKYLGVGGGRRRGWREEDVEDCRVLGAPLSLLLEHSAAH